MTSTTAMTMMGMGMGPMLPPPMFLNPSDRPGMGFAFVIRNVRPWAILMEPRVPTKAGTFR